MHTENATRRVVQRLSGLVKAVAIGANALGTLTVLLLVIVMNIDVVARGVFHAPFLGVVEIVIFSMILIVFLQLPDVVRVNRLMRSDGFLTVIGGSYPRAANLLSRAIDLLACIVMVMIVYATFPEFVESFESCHYFTQPDFGPAPTGNLWVDFFEATSRCDYFGTLGVFTVPWWPANIAITGSTAFCALLFLFKVISGPDDTVAEPVSIEVGGLTPDAEESHK
ncbi:MAG: TRAP transporter small permease subunit [Rhizobiaceae bacterium]|nr:TRAP transporter small permease subunit [Rhizobiaceae bacterium]